MKDSFTQEWERLIRDRIKEIRVGHGWVRRLGWWIRGFFLKGPRAEIAHDWLTVNEFAHRAKQRLTQESADTAEIKRNLVSVFAHLECAQQERDFAQAWTYVNIAAALLPLVVVEKELDACTVDLRTQDDRLPEEFRELLDETIGSGPDRIGRGLVGLLKEPATRKAAVEILTRIGPPAFAAVPALKKLLEDDNEELRRLVTEALAKICIPGASPPAPDAAPPPASDEAGRRYRIHVEQLARALMWNMVNRRISLKISLWRSLGRRLVCALLAPLLAAVLWVTYAPPRPKPVDQAPKPEPAQIVPAPKPVSGAPAPSPGPMASKPEPAQSAPQREPWLVVQFIAIALLGFFGGTLSAFLKAREMVVYIPSYEVIKTHTSLRMLLGAAGALVVYIVGGWLFPKELQDLIQQNLVIFMSVGVVAGFSERLFIDAMEKAALNLRMTGATKKSGEKEEAPSPPAETKKHRA